MNNEHIHHPLLSGYDLHQIWIDGCPECERRANSLPMSMMELDALRFRDAWLRAFWWQHDDDTSLKLSEAEKPLLRQLWAMQVALERYFGWLVGSMPKAPYWMRLKGEKLVMAGPGMEPPIPIEVDPDMPSGTAELRGQDGEVLGRIIGIGSGTLGRAVCVYYSVCPQLEVCTDGCRGPVGAVASLHNEDGGGT